MPALEKMAENQFDLAIVDPPYGIGSSRPSKKPCLVVQRNGSVLPVKGVEYKHKYWDDNPVCVEYFTRLTNSSRNQIIWGENYFDYKFVGGRIVWDKLNGDTDQYDCEVAYCSINNRTDIVRYMWSGMFHGKKVSHNFIEANEQQGNKSLNEKRIHPTQKPVALYKWLLKNYAKEGDTILDTHLGSGSIAIACYDMGFSLTGFEIDKDYYDAAHKRFKQHIAQLKLF